MKKTFKTLLFATLGLFALASCEDVPAPYQVPNKNTEPEEKPDEGTLIGEGTFTSPFNVAAANKATGELQPSNTSETFLSEEVYVKGIVSLIESIDTGNYGNATYYISDDGSTTSQLEVYRGYSFGGAKFKSESELAVGDTIIVCGKLQNWLGMAYEFTTGSKIVYRNGQTTSEPTPGPTPGGDAKGDGTAASPFNVAGINQFIDGGSYQGKEVYFTGIITQFKSGEEPGNSYGNATFYISDDGKTGSQDFCVFRTFGFNGEKFTSADQLKAGDLVVIRSTVTVYNGTTKQTEAGKGVLVSVNGKQEYSGGGDTPEGGAGTLEKPYTVAQALDIISAGTYTKDKVYVSGIVSRIDEISTQYGNATYYISDDGKTDRQLQVFRGYALGGEKFQSEDDLTVNDKVIVLGELTLYNNKTPEITGSQLYAVNNETAGGGGGGNATGDASTFNAADLGLTNGEAFDKVTYNGLTVTADGGGNTNTPKYYDSGTNLRMYPKNSITISAGKTISSITLTCTSGSVANGNVNASKGEVNVSDPTISITGINDKSVTITNNDSSTGAASQIRIVKFDITYAE